jgi:DNA-binding NtrC family response regulator
MGQGEETWLVVEDNASWSRVIVGILSGSGRRLLVADTVKRALELLSERPGVLLLDYQLPDGTGADVVRALAGLDFQPVVVAMSAEASTEQAFELGQLGVRSFLQKPTTLERVALAVERARAEAPDITPWVRASVGHRSLFDAENEFRRVVLREALGRAKQSKSAAARLLGISRQALQHVVRALEGD